MNWKVKALHAIGPPLLTAVEVLVVVAPGARLRTAEPNTSCPVIALPTSVSKMRFTPIATVLVLVNESVALQKEPALANDKELS